MSRFTLAFVGKMKNIHLASLHQNYEKLLRRYARLDVHETKDVKQKGNANVVRQEETKLLIKLLPKQAYIVAMDEHGKQMSTDNMAAWFEELQDRGEEHVCFLVGGPDGLHRNIMEHAHFKLALSNLTFTHEMARVLLLEQLYRVKSSQAGHPYHRGGEPLGS